MTQIHARNWTIVLVYCGILLAFVLRAGAQSPATAPAVTPAAVEIFDPNPQHLWNRLYATLWVRQSNGQTYGADRLDPLLWDDTQYLLAGPEHDRAVAVLDEFISKHGEQLIDDPLRRAILQRDLWSVFDWVGAEIQPINGQAAPRNPRSSSRWTKPQQRELLTRLSMVIQRLALTKAEIEKLPNNYSAAVASKAFAADFDPDHPETPFLPPDLLDSADGTSAGAFGQPATGPMSGPWVCLGIDGVRTENNRSITPAHTEAFGDRYVFQVFLRLPGGRTSTLDYLAQLKNFPNRFIQGTGSTFGRGGREQAPPILLNRELPQFPGGTQLALVRTPLLLDDQGDLVAAPLTESIQIRVYRQGSVPGEAVSAAVLRARQVVYEFDLSRPQLFARQSGGLRALTPDDRDFLFVQFRGQGIDSIELSRGEERLSPVLASCFQCHGAPGIQSVQSFTQLFAPPGQTPPSFKEVRPDVAVAKTIGAKKRQYSWGLLSGLMSADKSSNP